MTPVNHEVKCALKSQEFARVLKFRYIREFNEIVKSHSRVFVLKNNNVNILSKVLVFSRSYNL